MNITLSQKPTQTMETSGSDKKDLLEKRIFIIRLLKVYQILITKNVFLKKRVIFS